MSMLHSSEGVICATYFGDEFVLPLPPKVKVKMNSSEKSSGNNLQEQEVNPTGEKLQQIKNTGNDRSKPKKTLMGVAWEKLQQIKNTGNDSSKPKKTLMGVALEKLQQIKNTGNDRSKPMKTLMGVALEKLQQIKNTGNDRSKPKKTLMGVAFSPALDGLNVFETLHL